LWVWVGTGVGGRKTVGMWCGWRGYYLRGRTPPLHPEDVNEIRKNEIWYGWEGGREGGREGGTWGVPLNPFGFYSLSRKLSLSITTSTHAQ